VKRPLEKSVTAQISRRETGRYLSVAGRDDHRVAIIDAMEGSIRLLYTVETRNRLLMILPSDLISGSVPMRTLTGS